jgi:hypothetical protein
MPTRRSFVKPGDLAEVGDEVVFHGDHGNLVRGLVAERTLSPLTQRTMYRVVDLASELFDADAGKWIADQKLYMTHPLRNVGEAL